MDTETAVWMAHKVAELTHLVIRFQAQFGTGYKLVDARPQPASALCEAILTKQFEIAALLDDQACQLPIEPQVVWWNRQDVMDIVAVTRLSQGINRLIACCTFYEANPSDELMAAILRAEARVAGLLHPDARCNLFETAMAIAQRS